jgi:Fe-S cluster biogenesis protein NfuA
MIATASSVPAPEAAEPRELAAMVSELERLELVFRGWTDAQRGTIAAYKRAIDELHGEAVRRLVRACKAEPAARAALRAAVSDEVVYSVLRQLQVVKPSLDERVEQALAGLRPQLASHGGDVELVRIEPPIIELRLVGACDGCASSMTTFYAGIRQAVLAACPEIADVVHTPSRRHSR